jgi:predicted protein tyrosine phosphatase
MTHPNIRILGKFEANSLLENPSINSSISHIISINDPGENPPANLSQHNGDHLILSFYDLTKIRGDMILPSYDDVSKIIDFAKQINKAFDDSENKDNVNVLVHCHAGISRSSAAALAILAERLEPSQENADLAISQLLNIKQQILPNYRMVTLIDRILGYNRMLLRSLDLNIIKDTKIWF